MPESFIGTVQEGGRVVIKHEIRELQKIKTGDKVRIIVEKVV